MIFAGRTLMQIGFFLLFSAGLALPDSPRYEPVSGFDVNRYLGKWYEIARLPASFEKGWVNVTTTYSLRDDGKINVANEGRKDSSSGKRTSVSAKAKFAGKENVGYLRISFFWPLYFDYIIIALDPEYSYAMVANSPNYLWILAREPVLDQAALDSMCEKARNMGFKTEKLLFTPQQWDESPGKE